MYRASGQLRSPWIAVHSSKHQKCVYSQAVNFPPQIPKDLKKAGHQSTVQPTTQLKISYSSWVLRFLFRCASARILQLPLSNYLPKCQMRRGIPVKVTPKNAKFYTPFEGFWRITATMLYDVFLARLWLHRYLKTPMNWLGPNSQQPHHQVPRQTTTNFTTNWKPSFEKRTKIRSQQLWSQNQVESWG